MLTDLAGTMFSPQDIEYNIQALSFDEQRLSQSQKMAIYRIAQEQCTNIVKYALAHTVEFTMKTEGDNFYMSIADDGKGMEISSTTQGIGLRNINGRLSVFNGTMNIVSSPGNGFVLEISMPCQG